MSPHITAIKTHLSYIKGSPASLREPPGPRAKATAARSPPATSRTPRAALGLAAQAHEGREWAAGPRRLRAWPAKGGSSGLRRPPGSERAPAATAAPGLASARPAPSFGTHRRRASPAGCPPASLRWAACRYLAS